MTGSFTLMTCAMRVRSERLQVFSAHFLRAVCRAKLPLCPSEDTHRQLATGQNSRTSVMIQTGLPDIFRKLNIEVILLGMEGSD